MQALQAIRTHIPGDLRCACGSLLARPVPGRVALKCRRARRLVVMPLTGAAMDRAARVQVVVA
jgi:hypothetical protein